MNPMKSRSRRLHQDLVDTYGGMITDIQRRLDSGETVDDCLAKTMLTAKKDENLDHLDMAILASGFMIGGVETVSLCFSFYILQI
jgi:cytochrome P450